ncbi:MAG: hypothetical protein J6U92_06465, partial [Clostridia bacterium]|nr:hypothetical protein [Clostridia bacterium]
NGYYSVCLVQDGELKRVFYMLDSNGCSSMSALSFANGHSKKTIGFGNDQIEWYTTSINSLKSKFPNVKLSMAFHIQLAVFADAYEKYGYEDSTIRSNPINLENLPEAKAVGDFGYIGRPLKGAWDTDGVVWNGIKSLGVDSIFVGHEHCNSASVTYQGVRLTYGQKSSTFDRYNCIENGVYYEFANGIKRDPVMGGTYFNLSADGSIADAGLYLYDKNVAYVDTAKEQAELYPETDVENRIYYDETCVNYSMKNLSGKKDVLLGGESMFLPIDGDAYSLSFAFTPNTFNGTLTISGFVGSATSSNGIKVTLNNNKITIGLSSVNYTFINGAMYDVEVGFVNLYNGNTTYAFVIIDGQTVVWEFVETKDRDSGNVLISANSTGDKFTFGIVSTLDTSAKNEWALGNKDVTATFNYDLKNSEYGANNWYYGAVTEYTNLADNNSYLQAEGFWIKQDYYNMNFRPLFYQTVPNAINPSINLGYYSGDFMMASHAVHSIKADTTTGNYNRFANYDYQGLVYTFTDLETGNYFNLKVYSKVSASDSTLQRGYIQISYNGGDYSADKLTYYYFGGQYRQGAGNASTETFHFLNIKYDKDSNSIKHSTKLSNEIKLSELGIPAFNNYKVDMEFLSVRDGRTAGLMVYYLNGYDLTTIESKEDLESNENVLYIKSNNFEVASGASISVDDIVGVYNSASGEVEKDFAITIKDTAQNQVSLVDKKFVALAGKYNVVATLGTNTLSFMINISIT